MVRRYLAAAAAFLCWPVVLWAHVPIFPDGSGTGPDSAVQIDDVTISQVVYGELTTASPQLWLTFSTSERMLKLQLGIPKLDRLAEFRPALAVLGPGLPDMTLPFSTPAGLGGVLFTSDAVDAPESFHEPFTGTDSWILKEVSLALPQAGQYYIVAFAPGEQVDKLWVSVGERERFTAEDLANLPDLVQRVREFHEGSASSPPCFLIPAAALWAGILSIRARRTRKRR